MRTLIYSKHFDVPFELHKALLAHCYVGFKSRLHDTPADFRQAVLRGGFDFGLLDLTRRGPLTDKAFTYLDTLAVHSNGRIALLLCPEQAESAIGLESFFRLLRYPVVDAELISALKVPISCAQARNERQSTPPSKLENDSVSSLFG